MRRLAAPVAVGVAVVALALAGCGGAGGGEAVGALELDLVVVDGEPAPEASLTWRLEVTNATAAPVTLTFPDAQRGEVVLRRDGEEAYRWSDGRMFGQAVERDALAPGSSLAYDLEEPALDVEPGEYELAAELTSTPAPEPVRRRITVAG